MHRTNRFSLLVGLAALMVGLVMIPAGAAGVDSSVSTTIVTPISLQKLPQDLNFGQIASGPVAGSVTVVPNKSGKDLVTVSGVTLVSSAHVSDARFRVSGEAGAQYVVTLPGSATVQSPGGASMLLDVFASAPGSTGSVSFVGTLSSSNGRDDLYVGATLHVSVAQPAGVYTGTFAVTVAYQ